jgi:hypothetical protein
MAVEFSVVDISKREQALESQDERKNINTTSKLNLYLKKEKSIRIEHEIN